ncbi:hypothetical protein [Paludibacterium yongneupense]|uniref:hypothetical protein n=1 Tax=Paludibacterium yongneupense TaxID=400061 RepID=UPI0004228031|nr:hypothetical protein [Paludibacterium yongneupense]
MAFFNFGRSAGPHQLDDPVATAKPLAAVGELSTGGCSRQMAAVGPQTAQPQRIENTRSPT